MSYLRYLCLFAYSGVQHILCCVAFLFCLSSSCVPYVAISLDCSFLLPLLYSLTFICHVSCVPYVVRFSGLSIFDCPFGIL
jgi:hypothetical protein